MRHPLSGDTCLAPNCRHECDDIDYSTYFGRTLCQRCRVAWIETVKYQEPITLELDGQALQQGLAI